MRHRRPDPSKFSTHNLVTGLSKLPKHRLEALLLIIPKRRKIHPSHSSMPRNYETVNVADLRRSKKKAKLIEWEPRETYRGTKDVPVVLTSGSRQQKPMEKASKLPLARAENNEPSQGEAAPQSMDVDETSWAEEPVIFTSEKRVRQHACPSSANLTYLPVPAHLH